MAALGEGKIDVVVRMKREQGKKRKEEGSVRQNITFQIKVRIV